MAGKYSAVKSKKKKSKTPVIIVCTVAAMIISVAVILIILFGGNLSDKLPSATAPSTAEQTTAISSQNETVVTTQSSDGNEQVTSDINSSSNTSDKTKPTEEGTPLQSSNSDSVVVPGELDNASYFNATFTPYKAVDSISGEDCSLKEVFGSSYSGGSIEFKSNGSFTDSLITSSSNSGAYAVQDNSLKATYSNDKNMDVTVNSWDGSTPTEIVVNYGGYNVFLN